MALHGSRVLLIVIDPKDCVLDLGRKSWAIQEKKMKWLTIDIPESLHRTVKSQCAMQGKKIADEIRELLLQKYGNN